MVSCSLASHTFTNLKVLLARLSYKEGRTYDQVWYTAPRFYSTLAFILISRIPYKNKTGVPYISRLIVHNSAVHVGGADPRID